MITDKAELADIQVLEQLADVDWLTVTSGEGKLKNAMFEEAQRVLPMLKELGFVAKPWSFKGYKGWMCGGFRWGTRDDSDICMLSGETARMNFGVFLKLSGNISRIDLAVTVTLAEPVEDVAFAAYQTLGGPMFGEARCKRKLTYMTNTNGGQTLYVGSRASDQYGRLYDKGAEQRDGIEAEIALGQIWRYEVEFKKYRAKRVGEQLLAIVGGDCNVHNVIGATVHKWFLSRGVPVLASAYEEHPFLTDISATITDDEKTIQWLSTQVSPSVSRLIKNGKVNDVVVALGISNLDTARIA